MTVTPGFDNLRDMQGSCLTARSSSPDAVDFGGRRVHDHPREQTGRTVTSSTGRPPACSSPASTKLAVIFTGVCQLWWAWRAEFLFATIGICPAGAPARPARMAHRQAPLRRASLSSMVYHSLLTPCSVPTGPGPPSSSSRRRVPFRSRLRSIPPRIRDAVTPDPRQPVAP